MRMSHFHAAAIGAHLTMLGFCVGNGFVFPGLLNLGFGFLQYAFFERAVQKERS